MRNGLHKAGISIIDSVTPIIPIYTYDSMKTFVLTQKLFDEGVYANPVVAPATPEGSALIRTSYMASHTTEILDEALEIIARVIPHDLHGSV